MNAKEWKLEALTDIWTGDVNQGDDRLIPTGLMGSIRWWFEVLVRGLDGKACDPTVDGVRCPDHEGRHCVVCELFGCTGWARKFRLVILNENGKVIQNQIRAGQTFILKFIPLRPIAPEEWCLLDATLRLIAEYGAIGGKTVFKPSEEWGIADLGADDLDDSSGQVKVQRSRHGLPLSENDVILEVNGNSVGNKSELEGLLKDMYHAERVKIKVRRSKGIEEKVEVWAGKRHHQDFGLVAIKQRPEDLNCSQEAVKAYVSVNNPRWRTGFPDYDFSWASLQNFWCVKGRYLARQDTNTSSFNFVIGRPEPKHQSSQGDSWLAGRWPNQKQGIESESKKVFSFKQPSNASRTFGFVQNAEFTQIRQKLEILRDGNGNGRQPDPAWQSFDPDKEFLTGEKILNQLFRKEEVA